ncbi:MAG: hypothetical protein FJ146_14725 [Deltaproteobacteria bacterium]|nr:hypothetical protein [Deltaproteobacteria bacterium]
MEAFHDDELGLTLRSEKFRLIAKLVSEWEQDGGAPPESLRALIMDQRNVPKVLPTIRFGHDYLICNGASLDLHDRPVTMRLFRAFCRSPTLECSREDLLTQVYRIRYPDYCTDRYVEAVYAKTVKLISRARILATTILSHAVGFGIEWFVYDQERKIWCLYRMRNEYLNQKLGLSSLKCS